MSVKIVIGAAFGDEGKGYTTDYLCRQNAGSTLVVRHNGGAQAGHTVTTDDGRSHVFHSFGSGTFAGADTFLADTFIFNPDYFLEEAAELHGMGVRDLMVYAHEDVKVTTPFDMMLNWAVEEARGTSNHGSCGCGINETMQRSNRTELHPHLSITIADMADPQTLLRKLMVVRDTWLPIRIKELQERLFVDADVSEYVQDISNDELGKYAMNAYNCYRALTVVNNATECSMVDKYDHVVIEGAQGLLLDQDNKQFFPHVTHSNTGLVNPLRLLARWDIKAASVYYATRCYLTRHGAGNLPHESETLSYPDQTNQPNKFQGSLRFAPLNLQLLSEAITHDLTHYDFSPVNQGLLLDVKVVMTCLNQMFEPGWYNKAVPYINYNGDEEVGHFRNSHEYVSTMFRQLKIITHVPVSALYSEGMTASDMTEL
jgi:adenylosuccinate synthase